MFERCIRTLLDMVRSMMSLADLPLSFSGYALETTTLTLNRAVGEGSNFKKIHTHTQDHGDA